MIYLLYGKEPLLIEKEVQKILQKGKIEKFSINKYDLETDSLSNILEDASIVSMFGEQKGIIVNNSYIFTTSSKKGTKEQNIDLLSAYLEHPNPDTILLFTVESEKLDERKKITKQMKKMTTVIELNGAKNIHDFIRGMLKGYQIDHATISLLIDRVGTDLFLLEKECDKIKTYKDENKTITSEDILCLTTKNIDIDIFNLIDNIIAKNKKEALESYQEMLKRNEEPVKIIIMLANQFRIMYQAKEFSKKGYTSNDIASILEIHPYRVKLALEKSRTFSSSILLHYLNELAQLDFNIKSGTTDKTFALEMFILGL